MVGRQHQGDGLSVTATLDGALLRCTFQRLEGEVTPEGLWLASTAKDDSRERFRVFAVAVGRECAESQASRERQGQCLPPLAGKVIVADQATRLIRPGLTEECSVSIDGVRQDFVISLRPAGEGDLRVELVGNGALAEAAAYGAKPTLGGSGRTLAYSRLRVTGRHGSRTEGAPGRALGPPVGHPGDRRERYLPRAH